MDFTSLSSNSTCPSNPMMMTTIQATTCGGGTSTPNKSTTTPSRYGNQKRRDWNTFCQYLRNHRPPVSTAACSGTHVLDFLRYLDQFGKTKVHNPSCPFFGLPSPPAPCPCPLRQAWGSLDALIGRLRAAYEEHEGKPEANPFGVRAVRIYLKEVRDFQTKARGVSYKKKRKLRPNINNTKQQQQKKLINITPPADHHHHHHHHHNHHSAAPPCTW